MNAMVLFGVSSYAQYVANGFVVLLAVLVSTLRSQGGLMDGLATWFRPRR